MSENGAKQKTELFKLIDGQEYFVNYTECGVYLSTILDTGAKKLQLTTPLFLSAEHPYTPEQIWDLYPTYEKKLSFHELAMQELGRLKFK